MDNQAYLDQITASTHPTANKSSNSLFSLPIFKILIGGVGLTIIIIIFGSILGSINGQYLEKTKQLSLRMTNLNETISTYSKSTKSSEIRAISSSASDELNNTNRLLSEYLSSEHGYDTSKPDEELATSETAYITDVNNELQDAKLNAILDRAYASKLNLELTNILALEVEIAKSTNDEQLLSIIKSSANNLDSILTSLSKLNE